MSEALQPSQLNGQADELIAEVVAEITDRLQAGQPVDVEAYVARCPEAAERIRRLVPALEVLEGLKEAPAPEEGDAPDEALTGTLGDFRLVREIGRGGMGVVYEAQQISLGRRVALKVLPFAAMMDPRQLARFRNEAHAAASLQHQGIVPVHFVGCERGVHYYAMQLIDGRPLSAVIAELRRLAAAGAAGPPQAAPPPGGEPTVPHRPGQRPPAPAGGDTVPLAGLLTERSARGGACWRAAARLGEQAALALQHAHDMGVLHRDVKPGNLLLDGRGNLWVTDFGLARVQSEASLTLSGDLVGTLRYMSPEQALARRVVIDQRTDVYSLGATLYELLTLRPAFEGKDRQELLRQIAFEEPRPPRKVDPAVPAELETIVLKALEKNPADRYPTAEALADDLRRYRTNQPIRARRPSLVQRARNVARRHPGVTVTAAVALVAGLLLGIAGLAVNNWMVRQEKVRTQDALDRAEQEKAIAQAVRDFLRNKLLAQADPRAQASALRRAGGKSAGVKPNPTIRELLDRAASELAPDRIEGQFPGQPLVQAELLKTIGEAYGGIGDYGPAISHLKRARDLQARELAANHPDTLATTTSLARAYLDAGKAEEAARLFELVRDRRGETLGPDHPDTLESMNDLARCYFRLGQHAKVLALRQDIFRRRKSSLGPDHPDTLASMGQLANSYAAVGRVHEALRLHQETLALRKIKLGEDDPYTLQSMNNLANCHAALGQYDEALRLHQETLERRRSRLGPDHPDTLQSMNNVAVACSALGRHAEARKLHEETLALRKAKLPRGHRDTVQSMNALAWILANCPDRTLRDPGKALELAKEAVELAPRNGGYLNTLGTAHYRVGDWKNTVGAMKKSLELRKGGDGTELFFLAMAYWQLGDRDQSRAFYDRAVQWMEKNKPQDEDLRQFRAEAADLLGIGR
jgi:serine/threonine protein kinase/tetratricopeptide (TPR) repeat protein